MTKRLISLFLVCIFLMLSGCGRVGEISTSEPPEPAITAEPEETTDPTILKEISDQELLDLFQMVYDECQQFELTPEYSISLELNYLADYVKTVMPDMELPEDYSERYSDWRPLDDRESIEDIERPEDDVPAPIQNNTILSPFIGDEIIETDESFDDIFTDPSDIPPELGGGETVTDGGDSLADKHPNYSGTIGGSGTGAGGGGQQQGTPSSSGGQQDGSYISYDEPSWGEEVTKEDIASGNENPYDTIYHPIP